ncbi:MAG: aspartyl protease family protein [Bacteroidota bacterium]|nr:aspartyl protease family protein [Bacteroidota bacterium]
MRRAFIISFFFILLAGPAVTAKPKKIESIPFEVVGSYVIIKARINNSSVLNLILDSGIRNTIITELMPGDNISLNYSDVKELMGLGGGEHLEAYTSDYNTLKIGKLELHNKTVYVLKNDVFNLSKHTGTIINGLIGVDFFQDYILQIDYTQHRLRFYEPNTLDLPKGYGMLPMTIEAQKMFVELSVLQSDSTRKQVKMMIDTGAELNAWFQTSTNQSVHVPSKWIQGVIGQGLNGIITGKYGHIPQIWFGDFCLKNPIVSFPDSTTITGILATSKRDGTIGSQLLSRFNMYIDYRQRKFYFKPNGDFNKRYFYNVAGIEIIQITPYLSLSEVLDVWANSPASRAGVKPGDQIIEINGTKAFEYKVSEIRMIFETPSKRPLKLTLLRGGKEISVRIDMTDKI